MNKRRAFKIENVVQMKVLASVVRQEIVDTVNALGACSIREIATALGRPADGLYYHVHALLDVGLLVDAGSRRTRGRTEALVSTPTQAIMQLAYDAKDPENVASVSTIVAGMLRVAQRDFDMGFTPETARTAGPERNLHASRQKAWLDQAQRREVNDLLTRLQEIFSQSAPTAGAELHSLTFLLAPVKPAAARRRNESRE